MNPRLLFVDDEPRILDSLRNLLRKHRKRWDMSFVLGGEEAMQLLEREKFDVVVSDMRMPKMDGARVLATSRERQPEAIRIILSGFSGEDAAIRAVPVAHQFLSKPCEAETLLAVVERALKPRSSPRWARVMSLVGGIHQLSSPPAVFESLEVVVADLMAGTKEVSAVLASDPSMSAKALQLANSAFFGIPHRVVRVENAVSSLGIGTIRALVAASEAFSAAPPSIASQVEELNRHAQSTARLARALADEGGAHDAISAAMLNDIGLNVLVERCGDAYGEVARLVAMDGIEPRVAEERIFGVHHAEVGAVLLELWGLPPAVVNAVALHHEAPTDPREDPTHAIVFVAAGLADALAGAEASRASRCEASDGAVARVISTMGWESRVAQWRSAQEASHG